MWINFGKSILDKGVFCDKIWRYEWILCFGGNVIFEMFKVNSMNGIVVGDIIIRVGKVIV